MGLTSVKLEPRANARDGGEAIGAGSIGSSLHGFALERSVQGFALDASRQWSLGAQARRLRRLPAEKRPAAAADRRDTPRPRVAT